MDPDQLLFPRALAQSNSPVSFFVTEDAFAVLVPSREPKPCNNKDISRFDLFRCHATAHQSIYFREVRLPNSEDCLDHPSVSMNTQACGLVQFH